MPFHMSRAEKITNYLGCICVHSSTRDKGQERFLEAVQSACQPQAEQGLRLKVFREALFRARTLRVWGGCLLPLSAFPSAETGSKKKKEQRPDSHLTPHGGLSSLSPPRFPHPPLPKLLW